MRTTITLIVLIMTFGCSNQPERNLEYLNGYWEIDEVTLPDGSKRDYTYNETIDFLYVDKSMTGFRKKVMPNLDGTFSTSDDAEALKVVIENDSVNIYYKTPFGAWKETVIEAKENSLIIQNHNKLRYIYKRYEPLDLN